jgi:hypothetical protein
MSLVRGDKLLRSVETADGVIPHYPRLVGGFFELTAVRMGQEDVVGFLG